RRFGLPMAFPSASALISYSGTRLAAHRPRYLSRVLSDTPSSSSTSAARPARTSRSHSPSPLVTWPARAARPRNPSALASSMGFQGGAERLKDRRVDGMFQRALELTGFHGPLQAFRAGTNVCAPACQLARAVEYRFSLRRLDHPE